MRVASLFNSLRPTWRRLNNHQRATAAGALLLIVATVGPFSFIEGAVLIVACGLLLLVKARADGRNFHLPFGDGIVIAFAGLWGGCLIATRVFVRPVVTSLLGLTCAAVVIIAGVSAHATRPPDDVPTECPKEQTSHNDAPCSNR
jgi:hypothetical protein